MRKGDDHAIPLLRANSKEEAVELVRQFLNHVGDGECEIRQLYEMPASAQAG